jgi:CRISPR/Cas system CSM-associated protein Csm3 (group 7 of RAMP superfamily)
MSANFKGGPFVNRYLIKAVLTAQAPFHIGTGQVVTRPEMKDKDGNLLQISAVATDGNSKAYIPGSGLRGALSDWLKENFVAPEAATKKIFGSMENEGKLEVWDAYCLTNITDATEYHGVGWDKGRLTYVAKSVAINPETGTAEEGKLYNYELVPTGARFAVTFSAQNLSEVEAALLLKVLKGFDHTLPNPIVLGAMGKLGFGIFDISNFKIYRLKKGDLSAWKKECAEDDLAGYDSISRDCFNLVPKKDSRLNSELVDELMNELIKGYLLPETKIVDKQIETLTLKLETPMVVRNGSHFGWKNSPKSKARNYKMEFNWGTKASSRHDQISDLYFSLKVVAENGIEKIEEYYHVPSSSVRGALRQWTIQHLLDSKEWAINDTIKSLTPNELINPTVKLLTLRQILDLFGFAIDGVNKEISKSFNSATRIKIIAEQFNSKCTSPIIDGDWSNGASNHFGPENVKRHIKTRNPSDRISHASKSGGLHSFLEFSKDEKFKVRIEITNPTLFDFKLLDLWESEINHGVIRIGGLTGIGRGRVSIEKREVQHGKK